MDDIKAGVQYIFQTKNPMSLALSATGISNDESILFFGVTKDRLERFFFFFSSLK